MDFSSETNCVYETLKKHILYDLWINFCLNFSNQKLFELSMEKSAVNNFALHFIESFQKLKKDISLNEVEKLALLIHNCMLGENRRFHTPDHIFDICKTLKDPLQVLSVLFHDVIYFQIDNGFPPETENTLLPYLRFEGSNVFIAKKNYPVEDYFSFCMEVFGLKAGDQLYAFSGMNEFLSAVVAAKSTEKFLGRAEILALVTYIEATIPFRKPDGEGKTHFEKLHEHITGVNEHYQLGLSNNELEKITQKAVEVANTDVLNFSEKDAAVFLENTWELISEANFAMKSAEHYGYGISKYRISLMKQEMFLSNLDYNLVFHQFNGYPPDSKYKKMVAQAKENLIVASEYLGIKVLTIAIYEALALLTGGDVPVSMFTGPLPSKTRRKTQRAENYLPELDKSTVQCNAKVLDILENGRAGDAGFDLKNAPVSAFIYKSIGSKKTAEYLNIAKTMFRDEISPQEFVNRIDKNIVSAIARASAEIALTRKKALEAFF